MKSGVNLLQWPGARWPPPRWPPPAIEGAAIEPPKKFFRKEGSDLGGQSLVKILPAPVHCLLLAQGLGRVFALTSGHFFHREPYAMKVAHTVWRVYLSTKT